MSFAPINMILPHALEHEATLLIPYPQGKTRQNYKHGSRHTLSAIRRFFNAPRDFSVTFQQNGILFYWYGGATLPEGELLTIQLEQINQHFFVDPKSGQRVHNMIACGMFLVDLGSPVASDASYLAEPMQILQPGTLPLKQQSMDVPRNVTISSDGDATGCSFIIRGEGVYGRTITEELQGPNTGTTTGRKAFHLIHSITAKQACSAEIHIGCGDRLGLPVFLEGTGYLIRELLNDETITGGTLRPGSTDPAALQGEDRRGTYTPARAVEVMNGENSLQLLLFLPNPGNIGSLDVQD